MTATAPARTVRAGTAAGTVVRCSATDALLANLATSAVFVWADGPPADVLERGLGVALGAVPVFAGSLRDGPEIVCDDRGAAFAVDERDETLADALNRTALPTAGYADPVQAGPDRAPDAPLFAARATRLADGALVLGVTWHHVLGDLASVLLLMRAWAAAVNGEPLPAVRIDADRDALLPADGRDEPSWWLPDPEQAAVLERTLRSAAMANRIVPVWFAAAEVDRMRAAYGAGTGLRLTANDVLSAHLVAAVRRVDGDAGARRLTMPVNLRRHLGLPAGTVGNLVSELVLDCPPGADAATLAGLLRTAVDAVPDRLDAAANRRFRAGLDPARRGEAVPLAFDPAAKTFSLRNWAGGYGIRLAGRTPAYFGPLVPVPAPWAGWICAGYGGDGWLATVVLPAKLAGRLRSDPDLHPYRDPADEAPALARLVRKLG